MSGCAGSGKRILFEGQGDESLHKRDKPDTFFENQRRLDGRGQIIAITDTGIDWDNCFVWESARSGLHKMLLLLLLLPLRVQTSDVHTSGVHTSDVHT